MMDEKTKKTAKPATPREINIDWERIIAELPGHVYWEDTNNVILGCNDNLAKTFGFANRAEAKGKKLSDVCPNPEDAARIAESNRALLASDKEQHFETDYLKPNGERAVYSVSKKIIHDADGNKVGIIGISLDITEQKKQRETEQQELIDQEKLDIVQLFTGAMAHELRTPLAAITLGASGVARQIPPIIENYRALLAGKPVVQEVSQATIDLLLRVLQNIQTAVACSHHVINMLIANIKVLQNSINHPIDLDMQHSLIEIVEESLKKFPFSGDDKKLIAWEAPIGINPGFPIFPDLMQKIIFNLLGNAIYYVKDAGKGKIYISVFEDETANFFRIKDTGRGIKPDDFPYIFRKFFSKKPESIGLGLAFCKESVERFGGTIQCHSIYGEYTEFTIRFPKERRRPNYVSSVPFA